MPNPDRLAEFTACGQHITGDEKGQAQIFLDRLFRAFGQSGCLDVGGSKEFRIRKADEDAGTGVRPLRRINFSSITGWPLVSAPT